MNSIVQQFDQAAATYDEYSNVQREIARELGSRLAANVSQPERILEIGCGTGHLTRELIAHFPNADVLATDASQKMVDVARETLGTSGVVFRQWEADEKNSDLALGADLVVSSMAFQWLSDLRASAVDFAQQAKQFAMTIPIEGTFVDWVAAHRQLGLKSGVREMLSREKVDEWLNQFPDHLVGECSIENYSVHFEKPITFVQSLRRIGANSPALNHSPVNLKRVFALFPRGIDVQYTIAFIHIQQKA